LINLALDRLQPLGRKGPDKLRVNGPDVESKKRDFSLDTAQIEPSSLRAEVERACTDLLAVAKK
jgi:hypothetical protein